MKAELKGRRTWLGVALCALGVGALAGTVIGGSPDPTAPGNTGPADGVTVEGVPIVAPPAAKAARSRIVYVQTAPQRIAPGPGGITVKKCPRDAVGINGYFFKRDSKGAGVFEGFGLDDQGSSPRKFRKWAFYFDNVTDQPIDNVTFGIVCDKDG